MLNNYLTVINAIDTFCDNHGNIHRFKSSFFEQIDNFSTSGNSFPIFYAVPNDIEMQENIDVMSFRIYCLDILQKDRVNEEAILNSTYLNLRDFVNWLRNDEFNDLNVLNNPRAIPVNNYLVDFTTGWYVDLELEVSVVTNDCAIPFTNNFQLTGTSCDVSYITPYLTCATVTGCTTLQEYVINQINNSLTGVSSANYYTTGATLVGSTAFFDRNDLLSAYTLDLSSFSGGFSGWTGSSGINSIIANNGTGNIANGYTAIVGGQANNAGGDYSSIIGGSNNIVSNSGTHALVSGGLGNKAQGPKSIVVGGRENTGSTYYSIVIGGIQNLASADKSFIGGGSLNKAISDYATIVNGSDNLASGNRSFIANGSSNSAITQSSSVLGGSNNLASGQASIVNGGAYNTASGGYSSVGGYRNIADGSYSSVLGGNQNTVQSNNSIIGNGQENLVTGNVSAIVTGLNNRATGTYNFIGGGARNSASTQYATVVGGATNNVSGAYSFIGAGIQNSVTSSYSSIVGGKDNIVTGMYSSVVGGSNNTVTYQHSFIGGGKNNSSTGLYSSVLGGRYNTAGQLDSVIAGGSQNTATGVDSSILGGSNNQATQNYASVVGGKTNLASSYHSNVTGGKNNTAAGPSSGVFAGTGNTVTARNSVILGGANITASQSDTAYVPGLNISNVGSGTPSINLGLDANGFVVTGTTASVFSGTTDFYSKFTSGGSLSNGMISDNGVLSNLRFASSGDNINVSIISPNGFYYPTLSFFNNGATNVGSITAYAGRLYTSPLSLGGTIDMGANKIVNMSPASHPNDAINLGQLKDVTILSSTTACTISIDAYNTNYSITALTSACTFSVVSGNEQNFDRLIVRIKDGGVAQSLTFDPANFEAKGQALPTTTVANKLLTAGFIYDDLTGKFGCVCVSQEI